MDRGLPAEEGQSGVGVSTNGTARQYYKLLLHPVLIPGEAT